MAGESSQRRFVAKMPRRPHRGVWNRAAEFYEEFWIQNGDTYREYRWAEGKRHDENLTERFRSERAQPPYRPSIATRH